MADTKAPNNKLALSRALGAAFLNHQVEQLEKSVSNGPAAVNWRDRRQMNGNSYPQNAPRRGVNSPGAKVAPRKRAGEIHIAAKEKERSPPKDLDPTRKYPGLTHSRVKSYEDGKAEKDGDVIVVDASVLVHALYQVRKWCREGREEIIIVPLEALNTLDLLKKGTSVLAQRARAASRILEAQVGTNPRIRVQRDDAFVLWDKIKFKEDIDAKSASQSNLSPEWLRRTICCARWETENPEAALNRDSEANSRKVSNANSEDLPEPKVLLAVLGSTPNLSPQSTSLKLTEGIHETHLTPVPLPAPTIPHSNRHEPRSAGTLVTHWAAKANIRLFEVEPTLPGRGAEDEDRAKRPHSAHVHGPRGRRTSATTEGNAKVGLVERPPAVMAMMEMVAQPSKVVRVLARGEKLDPDP